MIGLNNHPTVYMCSPITTSVPLIPNTTNIYEERKGISLNKKIYIKREEKNLINYSKRYRHLEVCCIHTSDDS